MGQDFIPEPFSFELLDAVEIGWCTTIGFGNCFSVVTVDGRHFDIVNFHLETLERLIEEGLTWPVKISPIGLRTAVVNDPRIAEKEYLDRFCEVCCPMDLLPMPQRLRKSRDIQTGKVSFSKAEAHRMFGTDMPEMVIESTTINFGGHK